MIKSAFRSWLEGLVFAEIRDGKPQWIHGNDRVRNMVLERENEVPHVAFRVWSSTWSRAVVNLLEFDSGR